MNLENIRDKIFCGDCLNIMKEKIPDECINLTLTSPPYYNARQYSQYDSYNIYLKFLRDVFEEVHRVTMEGFFFFFGDKYISCYNSKTIKVASITKTPNSV